MPSVLWRGIKCLPLGYKNVSELSYPPKDIVKAGRLNDKGNPCLYSATKLTTVFTELNLAQDDYVHIIGFKLLDGKSIMSSTIGDLFHVYKYGYTKTFGADPDNSIGKKLNACSVEDRKKILYIDAFLSSVLTDTDAETKNYLSTRLLAKAIYIKSPVNSIFYPSVQDHVGMNLALLPLIYDSAMHVVCSQIIKINKVRHFGFYDHEVCMEATGIESNGDFVWQKPGFKNKEIYFGLSEKEFNDMKSRSSSLGVV